MGIADYEERQAAKRARYAARAARQEQIAASTHAALVKRFEMIPFGQPILVGHHSEKRHRRDIERMDSMMRKSIEASQQAKVYAERAERIENTDVISSDDPQAVAKLKEKLAKMEALREKYKAYNKNARKEKKDQLPSYVLTNLGGNMRRVSERIKELERLGTTVTSERTINGVTIKENAEENRLQLIFPGKPSEEIRSTLKGWGFRWSPYNGAWQRQLNNNARYAAKRIMASLGTTEV